MKKLILVSFITLSVLVSGCNSNSADKDTPKKSEVTSTVDKEKEAQEPVEKPKALTSDETLALAYINDYLNSDKESKKKFVEENVHPDVKSLFELGASADTPEEKKYKNPEVIESTPFESQGKTGSLVLLKSEDKKEIIILVADDKVAFGYTPSEKAETQKAFDEVRAKFSTPKE